MMAGTIVRAVSAGWRPMLCLVALLAFLPSAAQAQDAKTDPEKARAEVKALQAQLDGLHKQMGETAVKLEKARANLAARSGAKEKWAAHHHHYWRMFAHAGMHHHMWAAHHRHFGHVGWHHLARAHFEHGFRHHFAHHHEGAQTRELERKVDRLEHEVHEMLHMLRASRTAR